MTQPPPPAPERPSATRSHRRGAAVRDGVMSAAVHELLNVGFDGLTIAHVAERAGVHVTSIYRRWKTKEQLVTDALIDHFDPTIASPDTGSLRGDLIAMCTDLYTSLTSPQMKALLRLAAMPVDIDPLDEARRRMVEARLDVLAVIFARAIARGEIGETARPDFAMTLEVLHAPIYTRVLLSREPVDEHYLGGLVDLLLAGLIAP
ncbi:TetR/AcrR family transcriptional regulator [Gordonia rubripertincta]|uniref:TetR/AcrR family transcriptional regulator n=1 Tax=Gordonia rubripertincta TaxID=36822 RepID=A0ABT4N2T8_GORRU|nr:TetR/AcrR family transcriptional regulator [Gordonia rubripertincta]MCZ4553568.1 TetR/AcrR family transcriptional regulator [Gordonia rubripertincta]